MSQGSTPGALVDFDRASKALAAAIEAHDEGAIESTLADREHALHALREAIDRNGGSASIARQLADAARIDEVLRARVSRVVDRCRSELDDVRELRRAARAHRRPTSRALLVDQRA